VLRGHGDGVRRAWLSDRRHPALGGDRDFDRDGHWISRGGRVVVVSVLDGAATARFRARRYRHGLGIDRGGDLNGDGLVDLAVANRARASPRCSRVAATERSNGDGARDQRGALGVAAGA
jgi:hypothetical protein